MRNVILHPRPSHKLKYLNAARGGGMEVVVLPFLFGTAEALPEGVDAVVVTSDLQGREFLGSKDKPGRLLSEVVAEELIERGDSLGLPDPSRVGVVLAGDLFARESGRGGNGDIFPALRAFSEWFAWVVAVGGNHDDVGSWPITEDSWARLRAVPRLHFLDGHTVELGGVRISGVSGVEGDPQRAFRRPADDFRGAIELVLLDRPELLVLHQGPHVDGVARKSSETVREALDHAHPAPPLCICGHDPWETPVVQLPNGTQVLNVDHRVVVLRRDPQGPRSLG